MNDDVKETLTPALSENRIRNLNTYLTNMQRSISDRLFFVDKVFEPFTHILDFGCANGELIKALQTMFRKYVYVGYDISAEMIEAARANVPQASFYTNWNEINIPFSSTLLNISSTLHEVYSYGTPQDVAEFRKRVFGSGFRYITLRDMMLSAQTDCPADTEMLHAVRKNEIYASQLADFERVWGAIRTQRNLIHYLLKYKYTNNWDREVHENYFPLTKEQFLARIPDTYSVVYTDHSPLPYIVRQIKKDFGIDLRTPTHLKIILERR